MSYRLPTADFRTHPWRIHEIAADFEVEDVWQLPGEEPLTSFPDVSAFIATYDPAGGPLLVRLLWATRWKLGDWFGWDDATGTAGRVESLRQRLPADLRDAPRREDLFKDLPFDVLFDLDDEFAAEIANKTVHGVLHLGAVPAGNGLSRVQMTVLVKPNGLFGRAYMAAIKPIRYALIYPTMIRTMADRWHRQAGVDHA